MSVNIIKAGRIVRTSKNLRGVLDYARVSPVRRRASSPAAYDNETVRHRAYYKHW